MNTDNYIAPALIFDVAKRSCLLCKGARGGLGIVTFFEQI